MTLSSAYQESLDSVANYLLTDESGVPPAGMIFPSSGDLAVANQLKEDAEKYVADTYTGQILSDSWIQDRSSPRRPNSYYYVYVTLTLNSSLTRRQHVRRP